MMPSLRERLAFRKAHYQQFSPYGENGPYFQIAIESDLYDKVDAVLAAAEAWVQAWHAYEATQDTPLALLAFEECDKAEAALLALFPPPDAKETP